MPSPTLTLRMPESLEIALRQYCNRRGLQKTDVARKAIAEYIGKADLAKHMRGTGRPPKPAPGVPSFEQ